MKFLRLPPYINGSVESWSLGTDSQITVLYPGDALLSESLVLPDGLKGKPQIRQWMHANSDACQWDSSNEKLLFLHHDGHDCHYWAVADSLWQYWQVLMKKHTVIRWMPEWMLLPPPADGKIFALKAGDNILFRHSTWCGGSLPASMSHLLSPLLPRWLCLPDQKGMFQISAAYCRRQAKLHGHYRLTGSGQSLTRKMLPVAMTIGAAFSVAQTTEYLWLSSTRIPPDKIIQKENHTPEQYSALPDAMSSLTDIQLLGPVKMTDMNLHVRDIQFTLTSELPCKTLQARLKVLPISAKYQQFHDLCRIGVNGKL
ncbi:hypothetical protein VL10_23365 [Leclercia adecarboxylata]|nr:hypothetical protein VL10_23365 [Leclercia adecarboxylata]KMN66826.1 hypothetical protein VK95_04345 [Leclercia sp. LK8]